MTVMASFINLHVIGGIVTSGSLQLLFSDHFHTRSVWSTLNGPGFIYWDHDSGPWLACKWTVVGPNTGQWRQCHETQMSHSPSSFVFPSSAVFHSTRHIHWCVVFMKAKLTANLTGCSMFALCPINEWPLSWTESSVKHSLASGATC